MLSITRTLKPMQEYLFLTHFLTIHSSSHLRLESKLNILIAEVRAGKREGSVISTQTFDTTARNDRETWEALRRELEDIGISPGIITEKRQFIIDWFQEAVAAGKLEEDVASNENDNAISLHESGSLADSSDHDDYIPIGEMSSMMIEPSTANRRASQISGPIAPRILGQSADRVSSPPPQRKESSRIRASYLLRKLVGRDHNLLEAASVGDIAKITTFLEKGVSIQTRSLQGGKGTALHLASEKGKKTTVRFLLSRGADVHVKDEHGHTALHEAANHGHEQIIGVLLEQGADIESKDEYGRTALMWAASGLHQGTVRLLLEQGADIESKNKGGRTALVLAAGEGYQDMVKLLLEQGADIDSKDEWGNTALITAARRGAQNTVQLLLDKGASINPRSSFGRTALGMARLYGFIDTAEMLRNAGAHE